MKSFHPTKSVKDMYKEKSNIQNIFAWNDVQQSFVVPYMQNAWENWFNDNGNIDWKQLPDNSTHFKIKGLDVLKIENGRVHKWDKEIEKWFDITKYFDSDISNLIKK